MVRAGLEPATSGFQVRRPNHSTTLPPRKTSFWREMSIFLLLSLSIELFLTFTTCSAFLSSFPVHFPADPRGHQYHKQRELSVHSDAEYSSTSKIIFCNAYLFLWDQKIKPSAARHKMNFKQISLHSTYIELGCIHQKKSITPKM